MSRLSQLIAEQRSGWSLGQQFYTDPNIFEVERRNWFSRQWMVIGHRSELPRKGDRIVRQLFDASIIVVNGADGQLRAFHNVCTHRGSRICSEDGHSPMLVCPYHAWSFRLDGSLHPPRVLPDGVDPTELGLRELPLNEVAGIILCALDGALAPNIGVAHNALEPALIHHGMDRAKLVERRHYPTAANWKLVLENFLECYHCRPSHPEYFSMNGHVKVTAMRDDGAEQEWDSAVAAWRAVANATWPSEDVREPGGFDAMKYSVFRHPIGLGRQTHSRDGRPIAPLMGKFQEYDGGETAFHLGRFSFMGGYNDHTVMFQFIPRAVNATDVIVSWFVDEAADTDEINLEDLTFLWDVTTRQDKQIIEANCAGVQSPGYRPGPYTLLEDQTSRFVRDYLTMMAKADSYFLAD